MNRIYYALLFLLLINFNSSAQKSKFFVLNGEIKADTGTMILLPVGNTSYFESLNPFLEAKVMNGKFTFKGNINYPVAFAIGLKVNSEWKYISSFFMVEPIVQSIICNIDSLRETPRLYNNIMQEFDKYIKLKNREKAIPYLLDYTKLHRESYVALWRLVYEFDYMYTPLLDSVYNNLSNSLKTTYSAKVLATKMRIAQKTAIGGFFPDLSLSDTKNKIFKIITTNKSSNFTLIDFWFSHCTPCISQFNDLKNVYSKYNSNLFEIIGISVDTKDNKQAWKNVINVHKLPWPQYWDIAGKEAGKLNINTYPSNFLLDNNGKILAKNLLPSELEKFLAKYLNNP